MVCSLGEGQINYYFLKCKGANSVNLHILRQYNIYVYMVMKN